MMSPTQESTGPRTTVEYATVTAWFPAKLTGDSWRWRWLVPVYRKRIFEEVYDFASPGVRVRTYYYVPEEVTTMKLRGEWVDST
jgi:hypothetical protein